MYHLPKSSITSIVDSFFLLPDNHFGNPTMKENFFQDTTLGRVVHDVSRGRLFSWEEERDASVVEKYVENNSSENSDRVSLGENGKDMQLVGWSENDPRVRKSIPPSLIYLLFKNPRCWSTPKKVFVTFQICLLTTSVYIGSSIYTPGTQDIMKTFQVSETKAILGLILFVLGYGLGPTIFAPMSEIPYIGRGPVYIGTLFVFVLLQLGVIYAKNISMLLAFRFLTGFVGSPVLATGGASISDMYAPSKRAYGIAIWGVAAVCGPALGPLVGGFAAENKGWTWTIWELMWLSGFCLVFLIICLPETSSSNILYRRTARLRKSTGNSSLKCEPEIEAEGMSPKEIAMMVLIRPFTLSFFEPIVFLLNLYIALIYALLYLWFESFPIVFGGIYHFSLSTEGLAFLGIFCGVFVVIPPFFYYLHKYTEPQFNSDGELKPELRLPPACVGAFFIPICLFWFGWSARASIHWIMPIIGSAFFTIGAFLLFNSVLNYLGDAYPKYAASVYASNDLMRSSFGAGFPLFANAMYKKLGVDWASTLLALLSILFIPIPFVLVKYGERIRMKSRMARHDL
jgi:DHA1 family multidrug resistance protein-like MFS transporter